MNSEVKQSTRIIKVINEHLAEKPDCKHDLKFALGNLKILEYVIQNWYITLTDVEPVEIGYLGQSILNLSLFFCCIGDII